MQRPGTTFILPQGTVDELKWEGPTHRIAVALHPRLLVSALDETVQDSDIELTEHWNLIDPQITAVLLAMRADLKEGSPGGQLYGEALGNALPVYLLNRYAVRRHAPMAYRGGLPGYRLKRVLDYIGEKPGNQCQCLKPRGGSSMSPHYFAELFKKSTGRAPRRIDQVKQDLYELGRSIIKVVLAVRFQNLSHFARVFWKFVGINLSRFHSEVQLNRRYYI